MNEPILPFLSIEDATVVKNGKILFQNLEFTIQPDEQWAILAASGSEKTAFLETLYGRTSVTQGRIHRFFSQSYQTEQSKQGKVNSFRDLVSFVSQAYTFRNKSNIQEFYYQQRFNSSEADDTYTVSTYLDQVEETRTGFWNKQTTMDLLGLTPLADKSLIKLSNGETRRLAIAAALLRNPKLFLMDRPMTGLDKETRDAFDGILRRITESGIQIVMTTSAHEIPSTITHVGMITDGRLVPVSDLSGVANQTDLQSLPETNRIAALILDYPTIPYTNLIDLRNVTIQYGSKKILDSVSWTVKAGERWVLKGHNGAGKSTLISLLLGENPQSYAVDFSLFDRKRGTGESIWEVKKPIGFVSPELSRFFPKNQTCLKVVLSGLFDTIGLFRQVSPEQTQLGLNWLEALQLSHIKNILLHQVSIEDQRFCLLARAMIKRPALLILDEAAQGMDDEQRTRFKHIVSILCEKTPIGLIYVSHYENDIPDAVENEITLVNGQRIT
ncbi:putative molybdenum transport ATP-binding protein [Lunatimonas lonarensis]|uniref:Putative molybdenum transport ATP-binding protein n=1 Tax=Lunatimonas lonarensis TaxID=1232681 RepID=R7ZT57_9BACT|nr:ATP-binding cassette domain-containing protein [Lunatimonas lonarensis]EON77315.1 putative molybdenum transport ATP-binding protein [Lunatimonas lonarensis]